MRRHIRILSFAAALVTGTVLPGAAALADDRGGDAVPPTAPANLVYVPSYDGFGGTLRWDLSSDDTTPVYDLRYLLYHEGELVHLRNWANAFGQGDSFNLAAEVRDGFNPLPNGEYTVTAIDAAGNESPGTAPVIIDNLVDHTPPSAPTGLTYTPGHFPDLGYLDWGPSTDDIIGDRYVRYQLYLDGQPVPIFAPGEGGHDVNFAAEIWICVNDALLSGEYTVTAIDSAGNESASPSPVHVDFG